MSDALIGTIVGGALGITGGIVAQWFGLFSSKTERQHKYAVLQRERLERISDYVGDSTHWVETVGAFTDASSISDVSFSVEARKATALCQIYSPTLAPLAKDYVNGLIEFYKCLIQSIQEGSATGVIELPSQGVQDYDKKIRALRIRFDDAIAEEARKYDSFFKL
jgi:hypothetical protein